jgi:GcrA cell cycle regulator
MSIMTMMKLESGMCRWPIGEPEDKDFHFCADKCEAGSPYCPTHMAKAQAPTRKPKAS